MGFILEFNWKKSEIIDLFKKGRQNWRWIDLASLKVKSVIIYILLVVRNWSKKNKRFWLMAITEIIKLVNKFLNNRSELI